MMRKRLLPLLLTALCLCLLLCACAEGGNPETSAVQTTASAPVTEAPTNPVIPETETVPVETEPPVSETIALPENWEPHLNRTDISFFGAGESFVLVVQDTPAGIETVWTAENEEIASIDETGRVTAVGPGSARVYAEIRGVKLSCWIRCVFEAVAEDEPTLNKTDISFFGPGENFVLKVENAPENAEIRWSSADYDVATVDETGHVYAVGPGTVKVSANVNGHVLSCWVRCQFTAPESPRSNIADGRWWFRFRRDQVSEPDENGVYTATATLLRPIQISEARLSALAEGGELDLSDRGFALYIVDSAVFNGDASECTLKTGDTELLFKRTEQLEVTEQLGEWTLIDPNDGEPICYESGSYRLVFNESSACLDEMSAVIEGSTGTIRRKSLLDFFGRNGFEDELRRVGVRVRNGLVTEAKWYYHP